MSEVKKKNGSDDGTPPDIDPIIRGLLMRLPKSGSVWPEDERKLWLQLLEGSFKLIYNDKGEAASVGGLRSKAKLMIAGHSLDLTIADCL
jgi:hypothetical protein